MSKRKTGNNGGKGYYIALILCAVAIGITGYLYYANTGSPQQEPEKQAQLVGAMQTGVDTTPTGPQQNTQEPTEPGATTQPKPNRITAPVAGERVAEYAMDALSYNQTTRDWRTHNGIDIAAQAGTQVCAAADGTVYKVYEDEAMGTTVVIAHENGYATTYSSLAQQTDVKTGDTVTAGQTIGKVANTALLENAIGDHLHFAVSCNSSPVDPVQFLSQE